MLPEVLWCILHEYKYTPEICGYICFSISLSFAKPPIFHIDKMTCCPVSCPVSCLFSITKFGFIFSELHILFLKSDVLFFFTNNNWTNSFSNVWYQWDASRPCVRSRPCPPSPKKPYVSVLPKFVWSSSRVLLKNPNSCSVRRLVKKQDQGASVQKTVWTV